MRWSSVYFIKKLSCRRETARRFVPSTNTTLCVLSDVKSAAILCICVSICVVSDVSATVTLIGVKVCKSIHIGTGHKVSPFGKYPQGIPKIPNFWPKF